MSQTCAGKVALVTGAVGNGMGRSIALTLAREGAQVVINYRSSETSALALVDHLASRGAQAVAVQADVFRADDCRRLVIAAAAVFGQIDICIVGPGAGWHPQAPDELDVAGALEDLHHEVAPLYHLMPLVLPGMAERHWGRLVALGMHASLLSPAYAYNVGKAARAEAMRLAQAQTWQHGVTVNTIAPGPVGAVESLAQAVALCDHNEAWQDRPDLSPQDIAEGVAFLCSEAGRFVTGNMVQYMFGG